MKRVYTPLDFLNQQDEAYTAEPAVQRVMNNTKLYWTDFLVPILINEIEIPKETVDNLTYAEFKRFILSDDFMKPYDFKEDWKTKINAYFIANAHKYLKLMGHSHETIIDIYKGKSNIDLRSETRDSIIMAPILSTWSANKQIFKPDATFTKQLLATDNLSIELDYFKHLPYNTFYLDLSESEDVFGNIHGVYVDVDFADSDIVTLTLYLLSNELIVYSVYSGYRLDKPKKVNTSIFENTVDLENSPYLVNKGTAPAKNNINMRAIETMCLQIICYLNVAKPDIEDSPITKHTYKPNKHATIKNKFSELRIQDVGIRIGNTITKKMKEASKQTVTTSESNIDSNQPKSDRKPVTPHMRCAHWHRFWHGSEKDNTRRLELQWVEPTFVCGSGGSDAVIHPVK